MHRISLFFFFTLLIAVSVNGQVKLYEDQFNGGVTGGSFSSGVSGSSSGVIDLHIDPSSVIRKAYLIVGRLGPASPMTVNLNSMVLVFDPSNQATPFFITTFYGGISAVHAIDITSQVNPAVNTYNISYTQVSSGANFFTDFYLYVAYESNALPRVNTVIFLKTLDFILTEQYTLNLTYPIDTIVPVGFAMHAGYMCDSTSDGQNISVDGSLLGGIGGGDPNNPPGTCAGTSGSFYYENNTLYGLNGDSADQAMHGAEALSDIRMVVPNNSTTLDVLFEHFGGGGTSPSDNSMWAWMMAYGNSNVQPTALFASANHICPGTCTDFVNNSINATSFQWFFTGATPAVSNDVNPVFICYNSPGQYDVMLVATNSNGSDTLLLPNYITVFPYPPPQGIAQSGDTLFANTGAVTYQWYYSGNIIPGATDYFFIAAQSGNYNVVATDVNGCEVEAAIFDIVAGLEQIFSNHHGGIFPNPVQERLRINSQVELDGIEVFSITGERQYDLRGVSCDSSKGIHQTEIDVHALSPGVYSIILCKGTAFLRLKFIKQ